MNRHILYRIFLFLLVAFLLVETVEAQRNRYKRRRSKSKNISNYRGGIVGGKFRPYHFVGAGINALNYFGDLAPVNRAASTDISFTRPGFGVMYGYRFHPNISFRANYNWGRLRGDDATADFDQEENQGRYWRNLSFRNDIHELYVGVELFLFPEYNGPSYRSPFNIYLFVGGGVFSHTPKGKVPQYDYQTLGPTPSDAAETLPEAGEWVNLRDLGTEGQNLDLEGVPEPYSRIEYNVPVAIGAHMRLPGNFNVGIELGYRFIFTDYLDDVSGTYVDYREFGEDNLSRIMADRSAEPIAVVSETERNIDGLVTVRNGEYNTIGALGAGTDGAIRGNPDNNDMYFVTQIRLTYILPKNLFGYRRRAKFR